MCFSSFLYGPRANIIVTEVIGFIYTGFRHSHFEVMVVTDIRLFLFKSFHIRRLQKQSTGVAIFCSEICQVNNYKRRALYLLIVRAVLCSY